MSPGLSFESPLQPALEINLELRNDKGPIMHRLGPFYQHLLTGTINQLDKRMFTGKGPFIFSVFSDLSVKTLDNISGIDNTPKLFWVGEVMG